MVRIMAMKSPISTDKSRNWKGEVTTTVTASTLKILMKALMM
jgi:hypothetical protein